MTVQPRYRRVLLKISGEALLGDQEFGIDAKTVNRIAADVAEVRAMGVEVCLVVGGGNIFRGISGAGWGIDRGTADHMGMLATVINAVIFAAGTGNPFFTTDTAAALRASEMACDALLKGTQVDGVYSADPKKDPKAVRYEQLTYMEVLTRQLGVMDASAIALSRDNGIPILVFSIHNDGAFAEVVSGRGKSTIVCDANG